MSRRVRMTLLCEDTQQEAFARRYFEVRGWSTRQLFVVKAPGGRGAAEQYVRKKFPRELRAHRSKHGNVSLVVLLDGDCRGVTGRLAQLNMACDEDRIAHRQPSESVFIFVPTWSIETWFAYLDGETVVEDRNDDPRLQREKLCQRHVEKLVDMCRKQQLREPSPPSLIAACKEYERWNLILPR